MDIQGNIDRVAGGQVLMRVLRLGLALILAFTTLFAAGCEAGSVTPSEITLPEVTTVVGNTIGSTDTIVADYTLTYEYPGLDKDGSFYDIYHYAVGSEVAVSEYTQQLPKGKVLEFWVDLANNIRYKPGDIFVMPAADVSLIPSFAAVEDWDFVLTYAYARSTTSYSYDYVEEFKGKAGSKTVVHGYYMAFPDYPADEQPPRYETVVTPEFHFIGWNTDMQGQGRWFFPGDTLVLPEHDVTLYSQWGEITLCGDAYIGAELVQGSDAKAVAFMSPWFYSNYRVNEQLALPDITLDVRVWKADDPAQKNIAEHFDISLSNGTKNGETFTLTLPEYANQELLIADLPGGAEQGEYYYDVNIHKDYESLLADELQGKFSVISKQAASVTFTLAEESPLYIHYELDRAANVINGPLSFDPAVYTATFELNSPDGTPLEIKDFVVDAGVVDENGQPMNEAFTIVLPEFNSTDFYLDSSRPLSFSIQVLPNDIKMDTGEYTLQLFWKGSGLEGTDSFAAATLRVMYYLDDGGWVCGVV
jgi:hypothetical protein